MYFIGKCLLTNNDLRAVGYFSNAIYSNPFLFRAWWWAAISLARHCLPRNKRSGADMVPHDR